MKIRKGDEVVVIRGDDKGKTGRVLSVDPEKNLVVVQRIRLVKRHQKPGRRQNIRQGEVEKEMPIAASAVALVDPKSKKATRVRAQKGETTGRGSAARRSKTRVSTRSGAEIERPTVKSRG